MQNSGVSDAVFVHIYYSVNGDNRPVLNIPFHHSKSLNDIFLRDVTYNDDISVEFIVRNITTMSERSDPLTIRTYIKQLYMCVYD